MIQIKYIGTSDFDLLKTGNKTELMEQISDNIQYAIKESILEFVDFSCSNNPNLPNHKVLFSATINLIPKENISKEPYFPSINEN